MVPWWTLWIAAALGYFVCALMVIAKDPPSIRELDDEQSRKVREALR